MINKYRIDLTQFNNGESDTIAFPSFDQCLMYGMHKLKKAMENQNALIQAILIMAPQGRRVVVTPADGELEHLESIMIPVLKVKLKRDPTDGRGKLLF